MSVTCEHGREFLHFPLCSECPPDETGTVALLRWLANEHPAEAVAQLIADGVLVEIPGIWWDHRPQATGLGWYVRMTSDEPSHPDDRPLLRLNLPTEEGGDRVRNIEPTESFTVEARVASLEHPIPSAFDVEEDDDGR